MNMDSYVTFLLGREAVVLAGLAIFLLTAFVVKLLRTPRLTPPSDGAFVLVTGCDTGFGYMSAIQLGNLGWNVLAGCLTKAGADNLRSKCGKTVFPVVLDVTKEADFTAALESVKRAAGPGFRLHAYIGNAGIGMSGPCDWTSMDNYRRAMEVNFFGVVAGAKLCMPYLVKVGPDGVTRGRVINVASVAGILSAPGLSAYSASKYAVEAFTDALRREMMGWNMSISLIEPAFLNTAIIADAGGGLRREWETLDTATKSRWGEEYFNGIVSGAGKVKQQAGDPQLAVDAIIHAVTSTFPKTRYRVSWMAKYVYYPLSVIPTFISDYILYLAVAPPVKPAALLPEVAGPVSAAIKAGAARSAAAHHKAEELEAASAGASNGVKSPASSSVARRRRASVSAESGSRGRSASSSRSK